MTPTLRAGKPADVRSERYFTEVMVTGCLGAVAVGSAIARPRRSSARPSARRHSSGRRRCRPPGAGVLVDQEELRAVGVRAAVGHRQRARRCRCRPPRRSRVGLAEAGLQAGVAGRPARRRSRSPGRRAPVAVRVAALQHEEAPLVSRWHVVSSKKPCLARERKELTVHGALSASRLTFTSPAVGRDGHLGGRVLRRVARRQVDLLARRAAVLGVGALRSSSALGCRGVARRSRR